MAPSCSDGDACTTDACDARTGCVFTELPGIDFVACALTAHLGPLLPGAGTTRLAHALSARLASAERQVGAARGSPPRRARRHLGAARRIVLAMRRLAHRGGRTLGATIVDPIVFQCLAIARRIRDVQGTL
ncbi:MAG TPA: hypothetical protein VKU61_05140 [Candidatus Binatia bacterium]|nr:hypothetical protein [Candidatus Binatia bacterium]